MKLAPLSIAFLTCAGIATGCASAPPRELQDARVAYQRAAHSPGAPLVETDVYDAKKSLDLAEARFKDDGDEQSTRDLAYIAQRRAISAEARGEAAQSITEVKQAQASLQQFKQNQAVAMRNELESNKRKLTEEREGARQARQAAMDAFAKIADLQSRQTDRGLVLTLSGSVLFATGKSDLLPQAQTKMHELANALKEDKRGFTILGFTDSTGGDDLNQKLSEARAQSVKKALVAQGVDESRIQTKGMGKSDPVASNDTPEGRANNRRVEIVLANDITPRDKQTDNGSTRSSTTGH